MVFSSTTFLIYFLPIFLLVYQWLPSNRIKNVWFLSTSIFFYAWGAPKFVFILLASTIIDFFLVKTLHDSEDSGKRKRFLILSLCLNLGLLAYFKYANFFVENAQQLLSSLGFETFTWVKVLLPIGISFYTFQTLTYSIDVYRRKATPLKNVSDYLLYIMMFPQLIAGPIVRYNEIAQQLTDRKILSHSQLQGFFRFSMGLFKKVIIANTLGSVIEPYFSNIEALNPGMAWVVIFGYAFQIYFDFSGYSDMAIGIGKMAGFKFPENFNSPYISSSITEFWKRWHMTLGTWMRDYLYIPLGGNRVNSKGRLYFNLSFVFLMSGLWHGASWNFILWGIFHGLFLILDRLFLSNFLKSMPKILSVWLTFMIVTLSWVIFKIEDLSQAYLFYQKLFTFSNFEIYNVGGGAMIAFALSIIFGFSALTKIGKKCEIFLLKDHQKLGFVLLKTSSSLLICWVCLIELTTSSFNPFIYFRF